jgi:hypothetical protein
MHSTMTVQRILHVPTATLTQLTDSLPRTHDGELCLGEH